MESDKKISENDEKTQKDNEEIQKKAEKIRVEDIFFPYGRIREEQEEMIQEVISAIQNKKNILVHAPTGLGKTSATLAPALSHAINNPKKELVIFFLTSRHTQHHIAIETLKEIKKKYGLEFDVVDIIGKKNMCSQPGIEHLYSNEFAEYCKKVREEGSCEFYTNFKDIKSNKPTQKAEKMIEELKKILPCNVEVMVEACKEEKICPYEAAIFLAKTAKVIIADYYYVFNPEIRNPFLAKIKKELENCIIIIDEGHNLPARMRDLLTDNMTSNVIKNAIREAKKFGYENIIGELSMIQNIFIDYSKNFGFQQRETLVEKEDFMMKAARIKKEGKNIDSNDWMSNYEEIISDYQVIGDAVRILQKKSFIGSIGRFLEAWKQRKGDGFVRIFAVKETKQGPVLNLSCRCLDPALSTREVFENCYSSITMSGTLQPTSMYKNLLGLPDSTIEKEYENPFREENKLSVVVPYTTTKFSMRTDEQYKKIAEYCGKITNAIPGNSAIFFPSYDLRNKVYNSFNVMSNKTIFQEEPKMSKTEKAEMIERFKRYEKAGAVLLGAVSGSFAEGIDLPGDFLKCVIIVGLPLPQPDLETRELIRYYDKKFSKGWDYGYVFPAFIKCLQGAGRCIRSEKDRGVVVFLDERYVWPMYAKYFPKDYGLQVAREMSSFIGAIEEFFM